MDYFTFSVYILRIYREFFVGEISLNVIGACPDLVSLVIVGPRIS